MNVASPSIPRDRTSARVALVEQHIQFENEHDLEGVLRTFGDTARYDDEPWGDHYDGRHEVRSFYVQLMKALPDLEIAVQRRHVAEDAIVVEVMIRGTHLGGWRGLPATGRVPALRCVHVRRRRPPSRRENLLRSGDSVETTWRIPRAAKHLGTNVNLGDSSGHNRIRYREETPAEVTSSKAPIRQPTVVGEIGMLRELTIASFVPIRDPSPRKTRVPTPSRQYAGVTVGAVLVQND